MPNLKDIVNKYSRQARDSRDLPLLLAGAIRKNKEFVYSHPEYQLNWPAYWRFRYYLYLYKKNYPLAYLSKHKEFYGLNFYINKNVLVPRPETENLIDAAIETINKQITGNSLLVDVGTGSGCVPIAILKKNNLPAIAIDISSKALRVAKKNSQLHKTIIQFIKGNLLQPLLINQPILKGRDNLIITANLPYLTKEQYKSEPSIQREPKQALVADKLGLPARAFGSGRWQAGLGLYERLLKQIKQLAATNAIPFYIFLEIDPQQTEDMTKLINRYLNLTKITIKPDLAGRNRVVCINFPPLPPSR